MTKLSWTLAALGGLCALLLLPRAPARSHHRATFAESQTVRSANSKNVPKIAYHGGPIMAGPTHLYAIYYGAFTPEQHDIIDTFLQNVGGSQAFNTNIEYHDASHQFVQNALPYVPVTDSYNDPYSIGHSLGPGFDTAIIRAALDAGRFPVDETALYLLTVSADVDLPSDVWCAYHDSFSRGGRDIKFALAAVPPPRLYSDCSGSVANYDDSTSPNDDIGADEVADSLMHEISEAVTDPDGTAWYTSSGEENADLCNFNYGPPLLRPNGSHANHKFGPRYYLAQKIWDRSRKFCSLGF